MAELNSISESKLMMFGRRYDLALEGAVADERVEQHQWEDEYTAAPEGWTAAWRLRRRS
jgi:hypothetical protein